MAPSSPTIGVQRAPTPPPPCSSTLTLHLSFSDPYLSIFSLALYVYPPSSFCFGGRISGSAPSASPLAKITGSVLNQIKIDLLEKIWKFYRTKSGLFLKK